MSFWQSSIRFWGVKTTVRILWKKACENALMEIIFLTDRKPGRKPQSSVAFRLSSFVNAMHMRLFSSIQR